MKSIRINLLALLAIITMALSSFVPTSSAQANKPISKKELKVLLKTAKEPAEHRKIAEYYQQQAQKLTAESKEHEDLAKIYAEHPEHPSMGSRTPFGQGAEHCHKLAQLNAEQAKESEALAALHEDMAKAAEQKQP
jgi:hypothetical protein